MFSLSINLPKTCSLIVAELLSRNKRSRILLARSTLEDVLAYSRQAGTMEGILPLTSISRCDLLDNDNLYEVAYQNATVAGRHSHNVTPTLVHPQNTPLPLLRTGSSQSD